MSVAFRRESDEEHKEPRFELPIPAGPNLVTPRGLALIQTRVAELEAETGGDEAALADRKRTLAYWRTRLATAQVTPPRTDGEAGFGSRVAFTLDGAPRTIDIVGDDEAEPAAGRIAFTAPLARALIGGAAGDLVDFGGCPGAIEILGVAPIA
jgi:transcription elongation GreA/GreB family factor